MKYMSGVVQVVPMDECNCDKHTINCSACESRQSITQIYECIQCGEFSYSFCPSCYPKVMQKYLDHMTDAKNNFFKGFIPLKEINDPMSPLSN